MIRSIKYIIASFAAVLFFACSSSQKYSNSQYQDKYNTDDAYFSAKDLKKPAPKVKNVDNEIEKYKSKDSNYFYDDSKKEETTNPNAEYNWNDQQQSSSAQSSAAPSNGYQNPNSSTVINNYYQGMGNPSWNWGYSTGFSMFSMGFPVGNNMYMSFGYGNPFFPYYSPFNSPFYNPYNPFYSNWYNPYWGYNPYYGYNPYFYSPWSSPWYNPYYDAYNPYSYWGGNGGTSSSGYINTDRRVRRSSNFSPVTPAANGGVRSSGPVLMQGNPNTGTNANAPVRTQPQITNPNTTAPSNGRNNNTTVTPGNNQYRPGNISDYSGNTAPSRNDDNRNGGINVNQPERPNNNVYQPDNNYNKPQNNNNNNSNPSYQGGRNGAGSPSNGGFRNSSPSNNTPSRNSGGAGGGVSPSGPRRR